MTAMLPLYTIVVLLIAGVAVGALTGITGSSGVVVVVPVLSTIGLSFQDSVGSSLLVDVITTSVVIYVYLKHGNASVKNGISMGLGALLGAQMGTRLAISLPQGPLELGFVVFVLVLAAEMFRRGRDPKPLARGNAINLGKWTVPVAFAISIPVGILTGTLGASGGAIFTGIAALLFPIGAQGIVGTATLAMVLSALSGVAGYAYLGRVDYAYSVVIGLTSLVSGYFFSRFANEVSEKKIYLSMGIVFIAVGGMEMLKIMGLVRRTCTALR